MLVGMSFDEVPNNSAFKFNDRMDYLLNVSSCAPFKEYSNSLIDSFTEVRNKRKYSLAEKKYLYSRQS